MNALTMDALNSVRTELVVDTAERLSAPFSAPAIPVLEIAETKSGVDVVFSAFTKYSDTVAGFCDFAGRKLYVNANLGIEEQIFTMAHELGHWELHKEFFEAHPEKYQVLPRIRRSDSEEYVEDYFEAEANLFAAHLLVPTRLLSPVKHAAPAALASAFSVSRSLIESRLQNV